MDRYHRKNFRKAERDGVSVAIDTILKALLTLRELQVSSAKRGEEKGNVFRVRDPLRDRLPLPREEVPLDTALRQGVAWIHRAQDATPDRGVSQSYLLGRGRMRSYPETTGYIIPTLLNWSRVAGTGERQAQAAVRGDGAREQGVEGSDRSKTLTTLEKREAIAFLVAEHHLSVRRASAAVRFSRAAYYGVIEAGMSRSAAR